MDERLLKIHTLIGIIKDAEAELEVTINDGVKKERKPQACSKCGSTEHNARNCDVLPANQL